MLFRDSKAMEQRLDADFWLCPEERLGLARPTQTIRRRSPQRFGQGAVRERMSRPRSRTM